MVSSSFLFVLVFLFEVHSVSCHCFPNAENICIHNSVPAVVKFCGSVRNKDCSVMIKAYNTPSACVKFRTVINVDGLAGTLSQTELVISFGILLKYIYIKYIFVSLALFGYTGVLTHVFIL